MGSWCVCVNEDGGMKGAHGMAVQRQASEKVSSRLEAKE